MGGGCLTPRKLIRLFKNIGKGGGSFSTKHFKSLYRKSICLKIYFWNIRKSLFIRLRKACLFPYKDSL
jgi:hypothetical protein